MALRSLLGMARRKVPDEPERGEDDAADRALLIEAAIVFAVVLASFVVALMLQ